MKKAFILFAFVLSGLSGFTQGMNKRIMESLSMYSTLLSREIKYTICLPEDYYTGNKRYPVVYLLHGLGDNESAWLEYGQISQIADAELRKREIVPMIFVMPQGFRSYYVNDYAGVFPYQDMFIQELIPFIDSTYRTKAERKSRAALGYSMGGFGALVLPLKYSGLFSASVPLSVSIRTDEQYMSEDSTGWNEQWGRLFGGTGITGSQRITAYYRQNSPLPMLAEQDVTQWKGLKIFLDCGDDEQTLAFSNEALHKILSERGIPHEYRVGDGGHSFSYWREALPNGLRFISDAFQGKPYRGDRELLTPEPKRTGKQLLNDVVMENKVYTVYYPAEYDYTNRLYPVIYVTGAATPSDRERIAQISERLIGKENVAPFLLVFLPENEQLDLIIPEMENRLRIRPGFRFRSLMTDEKGAADLSYALIPERFTSCTVMDPFLHKDSLSAMLRDVTAKAVDRTWFFLGSSDKTPYYETMGELHTLLREKGIYHEYRIMQETENGRWKELFLEEALRFTLKKTHK